MVKQVSKEQKLERLLSLFTPSVVFSLKELEKLGGKVGVRSQLIKDLVTELVNENQIQSDKIGISHYYWKFPLTKDVEIVKLKKEEEKINNELETLKTKEESLKSTRMAENRQDLINEFQELSESKKRLTLSFNYDEYKDLTKNSDDLKETINEITEDIFILQSHVTNQFGMGISEFNASFGIKNDMDLID